MSTDRRTFLGSIAVGALGIPAIDALRPTSTPFDAVPLTEAADWDFSWTGKLKSQNRAIFDVPEVEQGYGVWRAIGTRRQYQQVLKKPLDMVLVLRHNGIALAMNQAFWDKYNVGTDKKVMDPLSNQPTTRNPVVDRTGANALPEPFSGFALEPFIASGGIVLGCALAFQECIGRVKEGDKVDDAEAEKRAKSYLVPGVILQPSGVFAALMAQDNGCRYVRAS